MKPKALKVTVDGKRMTVIDPDYTSPEAFEKSMELQFGCNRVESIEDFNAAPERDKN